METVKMYGPSISEPSKIVNRDVPAADVQAYKAAGYKLGSVPEDPAPPLPVTEEAGSPSLDSMSKAELVELAERQGLEVKGMNKADILELLKAG